MLIFEKALDSPLISGLVCDLFRLYYLQKLFPGKFLWVDNLINLFGIVWNLLFLFIESFYHFSLLKTDFFSTRFSQLCLLKSDFWFFFLCLFVPRFHIEGEIFHHLCEIVVKKLIHYLCIWNDHILNELCFLLCHNLRVMQIFHKRSNRNVLQRFLHFVLSHKFGCYSLGPDSCYVPGFHWRGKIWEMD